VRSPIWSRLAITRADSPSASQCSAILSLSVSIIEKEQRTWRAFIGRGFNLFWDTVESDAPDRNLMGMFLVFMTIANLISKEKCAGLGETTI
jgi:hypothetical protein